MSLSEALTQAFEDAYFAIINIVDNTKKIIFDLNEAEASTTTTIKSKSTLNRTLVLPDKDGILETLNADRKALLSFVMDYTDIEIGYMTLCCSGTLTIERPIQGKSAMIEVTANGHTLSFPPSVKIISGKFKTNTVNYVYFHCINGPAPVYIVTIGQQQA